MLNTARVETMVIALVERVVAGAAVIEAALARYPNSVILAANREQILAR